MAEAWAPGLADVAKHVPRRTRDSKSPGSDRLLMTFNANTTPTDADVQQLIDDAVSSMVAQVGDLPALATEAPEIADAARVFIEWSVSADIEVSYPNRDADLLTSDRLRARAQAQWTVLMAALAAAAGGGPAVADVIPSWGFPDPPPWGDKSPGSGVDLLTNQGIPVI